MVEEVLFLMELVFLLLLFSFSFSFWRAYSLQEPLDNPALRLFNDVAAATAMNR